MSLLYNKMKRYNPLNPGDEPKWYPVLKSTESVGEKEVGQLIADETTLNEKEAEMALHQLMKILIRLLLSGKTVKLSGVGSFRLTVNSEGSATEEEANANKIKKVNLRFTPSETMRDALKKATFIDASTLLNKK